MMRQIDVPWPGGASLTFSGCGFCPTPNQSPILNHHPGNSFGLSTFSSALALVDFEIRAVTRNRTESQLAAREARAAALAPVNVEEADFLQTKPLRKSIHARERNQCFYCLRRTTPTVQCLDHVVPQARLGRNSYRNLVSSCMECNSQKGEKPADDFLRRLYGERRLTAAELAARLPALDALASGKLRPPIAQLENRN
jgi:hypothetical protein